MSGPTASKKHRGHLELRRQPVPQEGPRLRGNPPRPEGWQGDVLFGCLRRQARPGLEA